MCVRVHVCLSVRLAALWEGIHLVGYGGLSPRSIPVSDVREQTQVLFLLPSRYEKPVTPETPQHLSAPCAINFPHNSFSVLFIILSLFWSAQQRGREASESQTWLLYVIDKNRTRVGLPSPLHSFTGCWSPWLFGDVAVTSLTVWVTFERGAKCHVISGGKAKSMFDRGPLLPVYFTQHDLFMTQHLWQIEDCPCVGQVWFSLLGSVHSRRSHVQCSAVTEKKRVTYIFIFKVFERKVKRAGDSA